MTDYTLPDWHYLYGKPTVTGQIRVLPEHFQVEEILPFQPDGEGENHMIHVEKIGLTTHQVADMLAKFAGVPSRDVSWAGLKDKHGITRQWLSVRIPGKAEPDWQQLNSDQLTILAASRHLKKLRTGALLGNRFKIAVSGIDSIEPLLERLQQLPNGVPNYYGEQRFGHGGRNVARAAEMFAGKRVKDRNKRSIYLSAARSFLFNQVLSARFAQHGHRSFNGDAMMLRGSNSFFIAEQWDDELQQRLNKGEICRSIPLWGDGGGGAQGEAAEYEQAQVASWPQLCDGLAGARMKPERRLALLIPEQFKYHHENNVLWLEFSLPSGAFATSILRELVDYSDAQAFVPATPVATAEAQEQPTLTAEVAAPLPPTTAAPLPQVKAVTQPKAQPKARMKILVSNDDGVHAPGIKALSEALSKIATVVTVAPDRNCSGASNSLTLTNPLRVQQLDNGYYQVNGTPTDCVLLGIRELMDGEPDLVISGINAGANLGDDTIYSGTVAAAMEGRHLGLPTIAVSLCGRELNHYESAAAIVCQVVAGIHSHPIPKDQILNINVPDLPLEQVKGIKVTRLGARHAAEGMVPMTDPAGRRIFWIGPPGEQQDAGEGTDFHAIDSGYASITPLKVDLTAHEQLDGLRHWVAQL